MFSSVESQLSYRKYQTSGAPLNKVIYQYTLAKQRKYYKKAKRELWLHYIDEIHSQTPMRMVWENGRKLSGKFTPFPLLTLKVNGNSYHGSK